MRDKTDDDNAESSSPWTQKGFIASAVVVALLAVLGIALTVTGPSKEPARAEPAPQSSTTDDPSAVASTSTSESSCGLPAGDQLVPTSAPADTDWQLVGTVAVPVASDTYGPGDSGDNGLRTCFAQNPTGALYAAANIVASTAVPELRGPVVQSLGADGPGRTKALSLLATDDTAASSGVQIAGFTFLNYAATTATVDLAMRVTPTAGQVSYAHAPVTLRWEDGDWKVVFAADGSLGAGLGPIPDLTGYAPWAGA